MDIYKSLGYSTHLQFILNLVSAFVQAVSALLAVSVSDRMPRRAVLIWGTLGCCLMLAANAGFSGKWASYLPGEKNLNIGRLGAASFFLFQAVYAFTVSLIICHLGSRRSEWLYFRIPVHAVTKSLSCRMSREYNPCQGCIDEDLRHWLHLVH